MLYIQARVIMSATTSDDILGAGLDIEGWSYHKAEVAAKVAGYTVYGLSE